jgi:hypothetical protein
MTVLDRINLYTLRRFDMIDAEKFNRLHAERNAGDRIEDLCESVQDAVKEVIRVCREHGRCERIFNDLRIEAYAYPHPSGNVAWGINSLITGVNTKRGIVR